MQNCLRYGLTGTNGAARLIGKRYFNGSNVLVGFTSAYDKSSNKLFERPLHAESRASLYDSYDSMNRLLDYQRGVLATGGGSVTTPISLPGTNQQQAYNVDALGNWSTTTITPEGGSPAVQNRTHNKLNEVTQYGTISVLYDQGNNSGPPPQKGNGNIIDDGVRTYAFDALNRLTTVARKSDGKTIGQYAYDALGRRIQKIVSNGGLTGTVANGTTRYLYSGNQCVEELVSGSTTRQFVWGQYIDELIQLKTYVNTGSQPLPAGVYYLLSDLLYRSAALTNSSASIVETYDTDAYGNTIIYSGPGPDGLWFTNDDVTSIQPACEYIFTGRQYDPESQLYFYRARYYHPPLGRFVRRDPLSYQRSLNVFEYVKGRPPRLLDPTGLYDWHDDESCCYITLSVKVKINLPDASDDQISAIQTKFKAPVEAAFNTGGFHIYPTPHPPLKGDMWGPGSMMTGMGSAAWKYIPPVPCRCPCSSWTPQVYVYYGSWSPDVVVNLTSNASGSALYTYRPSTTGTTISDDLADFFPRPVGAPGGATQIRPVHEFGHAIGLHHPGQDQTPPAPPNQAPDYDADPAALMGRGMEMRALYFQKWADRLDEDYPQCAPHHVA